MSKNKLLNALLVTGIATASAAASASTETIDFESMGFSAYYGKSNLNAGACSGTGTDGCYEENGYVVGHPDDGTAGAHLHQASTGSPILGTLNNQLSYHSDSSGIYIRALDGSAFSLDAFKLHAPFDIVNGVANYLNGNPATGSFYTPTPYWEILGFNNAVNPTISTTGDGTNYPGARVAYTQVANGFDGIVSQSYTGPTTGTEQYLDSAFSNVNAVWIHFAGYPKTPTNGKTFSMTLDNVVLTQAAPVPVPAAAWLFGSGLLGLLSFGRKKTA